MDIYADTIRDLAPAEKLRLVERIWDDLATQDTPIPLPDWAVSDAARRRDEMLADPDHSQPVNYLRVSLGLYDASVPSLAALA